MPQYIPPLFTEEVPHIPPGATITVAPSETFSQAIKKYGTRRNKPPSFTLPEVFELNKGFTVGCDPEGFLFDKKRKVYIPAAGIIPGNKYDPHPVEKGAIQVDGMAVEFNIDPVSTYEDWEGNITTVIAALEAALPKHLEVHWVPSIRFPEEEFDKAPDDAKVLGCQPDFDGWSGEVNPPPNMKDPYVRCAGGHLHVGFPNTKNEDVTNVQHVMNCQDLVQQFDWFLGGWSVFMDKDEVRRNLYGKMGACRYKPYGVEYRVLSNFWVASKELRLATWNRTCSAISNMNKLFMPERTGNVLNNYLRDAINSHHVNSQLIEFAEFPINTLNSGRCRL